MKNLADINIDKLIAGRELDGLISKEFFNECPHWETILDFAQEEICKGCGEDIRDYRGDFDKGTVKYIDSDDWSCPDYSTDLNAAFVVVTKVLEGTETYFDLIAKDKGGFMASFVGTKGAASCKDESAPLAICKAALAFRKQFIIEGEVG